MLATSVLSRASGQRYPESNTWAFHQGHGTPHGDCPAKTPSAMEAKAKQVGHQDPISAIAMTQQLRMLANRSALVTLSQATMTPPSAMRDQRATDVVSSGDRLQLKTRGK